MILALVSCAVLLPSGFARAQPFLAVTADQRLVHFDALDHTLRGVVPLKGVPGLGAIVAIDVRPATGGLYGIAQNGATIRLVRIDQASGALTLIGAPVGLGSSPYGLGLDFNPTTDKISFVADNDAILGFDPDTGMATIKPPPTPSIPFFTDVAWTPASAGLAVPYALDGGIGRLDLGDGSGNYITTPNTLGLQMGGHHTIDIDPSGVMWLLVHNVLYRVDTLTGLPTHAGSMSDPVDSLAVRLTGDIDFGAAAFGATESDGSATVTLRRAAPAESGAKVKWTTAGGTATAGADYAAAQGVVAFAPGQSTATVIIPLTDDGTTEGPERIGLHLTSVDGVPAGPDAAVVIADDDASGSVPGGGVHDTTAPVLLALPAKLAAKRTLRVPFGTSEAAAATVTLKLGAKLARRVKLPATLATATLQTAPGDNTAVLTLSRKAARKLRARRSTRTTAEIVAIDAAGNRATRAVKLTLT
jgi:hypothetical protein